MCKTVVRVMKNIGKPDILIHIYIEQTFTIPNNLMFIIGHKKQIIDMGLVSKHLGVQMRNQL